MDVASELLRHRMISILSSDAAQSINFWLDNLHIDGPGFSYVALALCSPPSPSRQQGLSITFGDLPPGMRARYFSSVNKFIFPKNRSDFGQNPTERMDIIHESTHALIDALKLPTTHLYGEAAAYLAGACFFLLDPPLGTPNLQGQPNVVKAAFALASGLAGTSFTISRSDPGVKLLTDAIAADPNYRDIVNQPVPNNGIDL